MLAWLVQVLYNFDQELRFWLPNDPLYASLLTSDKVFLADGASVRVIKTFFVCEIALTQFYPSVTFSSVPL